MLSSVAEIQSLEEYEVNSVHFCLSSEVDIRNRSVLEITTADLYIKDNREDRYIVAPGGLLDSRLGVFAGGSKNICSTCELKFDECPGHWGHIELVEPVYNINYLDVIVKILSSVCFFCGHLHADPEVLESYKQDQRLLYANEIGKETAKRRQPCPKCEHQKANILKSPNATNKGLLSVVFSGEDRPEDMMSGLLYAKEAQKVLQMITNESVQLLGLRQRPENMLFKCFPVPPLNIRPTSISNRDRRESELTEKLRRIVSANMALSTIPDSTQFSYQKHMSNVQMTANDYIGGESRGNTRLMSLSDRKQAVERKTLNERLKGKHGRVRGNMMGKRVNFCARTVIDPDPTLNIDQIGVPQHVCMSVTYPETVHTRNMADLYKLLRNGPTKYPGANYVIRQDGSRMDLHACGSSSVRLQMGDKVERHLQNNDIVVMNRQPSLHRMSMMGHKVQVRPGVLNFSLNLAVTNPYNADFDGDEMNLHVPQSEEARAEIAEINMVHHHIINPKSCSPVIKLIQDAMYGITQLTQPGVTVTVRRLSNILIRLENCVFPNLREKSNWTGRELFSFAIPKGIYMKKKVDRLGQNNEEVIIVDGQLLSGVLTSAEVNGSTGLTRIIHKELGAKIAADFLNKAQIIANAWLEEYGASIGISDMMLDENTSAGIEKLKIEDDEKFRLMSDNATDDEILTEMNKNRDKYVSVLRDVFTHSGNRIADIITSGSKGDYIKLSQMVSSIGTQAIRGKPLQRDKTTGRSLAYYAKGDHGMASHGYIASSYFSGQSIPEYMIHATAGREGLTDTAVKTSETGYIQRRLVKAMEDIVVRFDGTVRRSDGSIIQPCFGYHGMDPVQLEIQKIHLHNWSLEQFYKTHIWQDADSEALQTEKDNLLKLWNYAKKHKKSMEEWSHDIAATFHAYRLRSEAMMRYPSGDAVKREDAARMLVTLASQLVMHAKYLHMSGSVLLHHWLLLEFAASKVVVQLGMTHAAFHWMIDRMEYHFKRSAIQPGEAVGMIAAQAAGSDTTQMTLNTFHFCGQSSMDITLGVPRLKEIVDVSKTKEPRLVLQLNDNVELEDIKKDVSDFVSLTANSSLQRILSNVQLLSMEDSLLEDELYIQEDYLVLEDEDFKRRLSHKVLRLECDRDMVTQPFMRLLVERLEHILSNEDYIIMSTDDNDMERAVIHIRYLQPVTASGKVRRGKSIEKKMERALAILTHPKTNLLPVETEGHAQVVDNKYIVLNSRAFGDELMLLEHTDPLQSYCNDFKKVEEVLGIEAAREVLRREAIKVFKFGGTSMLPAHINLLVDVMTYTGKLLGVTRFGIVKHNQSIGPLMQCSFEVTTNVLRDAAVLGKTDHILGVSECIMLGRPPRIGTHCDIDVIQVQQEPALCDIVSPSYVLPMSPSYAQPSPTYTEEEDDDCVLASDVTFESMFREVSGYTATTYYPDQYGSMLYTEPLPMSVDRLKQRSLSNTN